MADRFKINIGQMASAISALKTDEACGKFFKRLLMYVQGTDTASTDPIVEAIFQLVKVGIDEEKRFAEKQRLNGLKGGAPKGNKNAAKEQPKTTQNNPKQPKTTEVDSDKEGVDNGGLLVAVSSENQIITENNPKQPKTTQISEGEDNLIESIIYNSVVDNSSSLLDKDNDISTSNTSTTTSKSSEIDLIAFRDFWNSNVVRANSIMAQLKTISGKRKQGIMARLREHSRESLAKVVRNAVESDFLNGKNDRAWVASFDWIFQHPNNFVKVLEGNYNNRNITPQIGTITYNERPTSGAGKTLAALTQLMNKNGTNTTNIESAESGDNIGRPVVADYCTCILSEKSSN